MTFDKPSFTENDTLFGCDETPGIVAMEVEGNDTIRVFRREDGRLVSEFQPFHPFFLLTETSLLGGIKSSPEVTPLEGSGTYRFRVNFDSWREMDRVRKALSKKAGLPAGHPDSPVYALSDPIQQHLIATGQTLFKGMPFEGLKRVQLDIETFCPEGYEFPNPNREEDRIIVISFSDNAGWEKVISGKDLSEREMLEELVRTIEDKDPDIIEGHNIFNYDLDYISRRAKMHKVPLEIGRDGMAARSRSSRVMIAERTINYSRWAIYGRHVVDTFILAQFYDVVTRELESFGLKEVAKQLAVAPPERTYLNGDEITRTYINDPEKLHRYALDDVRETGAVSNLLSRSYFFQAQIFPFSFQNVVVRGNAAKIDSLFIREYLRQCHAIPKLEEPRSFPGGYTDIFYEGVAKGVVYCDVRSLYPSLMLVEGIWPRKDELGIFSRLLADLREFRLQAKDMVEEAKSSEERQSLNALQSTFKILINSFYGYMGHGQSHFSDFDQAEKVTARGRELLQSMIEWLRKKGCQVIEIDTDGIYFVPGPDIRTARQEEELVGHLSDTMPEGILVEYGGRYKAMFSYKIKNYALLDYDGNLRIKGSGLRSRGLEKFQRVFLEDMISRLLSGKKTEIPKLFQEYSEQLIQHKWDVKMFMKTEMLQESLDRYSEKIQKGERNRGAAYELALKSERRYQPGDQISYYVTGDSEKVQAYDHCRLAREWDPKHPDQNVRYYQKKLKDLYKKFSVFFENESTA
ncbi:MAG: DNA polymerase II [Proteobacteria bacterium]|nr:DNA polymerase II [Pseudomonadota bacterium]